MGTIPPYADLGARIMSNVILVNKSDMPEPCWQWIGSRTHSGTGYGKLNLRVNGKVKTFTTHRLAYQYFTGGDPPTVVLHLCNNPLCCNPKHLVGGTQSDNIKHCVESKRHSPNIIRHNQTRKK